MPQRSDALSDAALALVRRSVLAVPTRLTDGTAWHRHIPFAFLIVDLLQPRLLVELGPLGSDSYWAFCQAVDSLRSGTLCHAVDTGTGDEHSDATSPAVVDALRVDHDPLYASFSTLLPAPLDEAPGRFEDGTIDLLHIDGLRTDEAVKRDFESWAPKLSDRAIVLVHGTRMREDVVGVRRYWAELTTRYLVREFTHGDGLGVLAYGRDLPKAVADLFSTTEEEWDDIGRLFARLGSGAGQAGTNRLLESEVSGAGTAPDVVPARANAVAREETRLKAEMATLEAKATSFMKEAASLRKELDALKTSVSWRLTQPLRSFVRNSPRAGRTVRRVMALGYWTMRGTLLANLRAARASSFRTGPGGARGLFRRGSEDPWQVSTFLRTYLIWRWPDASTDYVGDLYGFLGRSGTTPIETLDVEGIADRVAAIASLSGAALRPGDPDVSIVVPVHNALGHTLACLHSLLLVGSRSSIEIIVADDLSSDATPEAVAAIGGVVRLVRQDSNLGFLRNCNAAASTARGRFVVFLNNDTIVLPGWLDELVAPLDADDRVGLACSKLLHTDGSLQEAGGLIWSDGSVWNYGRGQDPRGYAFNFVREVDYGSGAAIALRRAVWTGMGGFDDTFAPAYCEDADLAFRLRRAGYRTLYTPFSEVIHHEGVSHGRDERSGIKAHQVANLEKLKARWAFDLATAHPAPGTSVPVAATRSAKVRILVVDHYVPQADRDAGSRAMHGYMRFLVDAGLHVTFWPSDQVMSRTYGRIYQNWGVEVVYAHGRLLNFARWWAERGREFDYVFLSRPAVAAPLLASLRRHGKAKLLFFGHDIHALRMAAQYAFRPSPALKTNLAAAERQEMQVWKAVDAIYYPSQSEADHVARSGVSAPARALPLFMFDESEIVSLFDPAGHAGSDAPRITFIGGFLHVPNVDGILWFHREVWPRIKAAFPRASLVVAGSSPTLEILSLSAPDVLVTGHVSDAVLTDLYRQTTVAIAPLRFGAGVKGKVIEALRFGIPLVTTSTGAQGIPEIETACDVTDDPVAFADAVIGLLSDEEALKHRSRASQALIRRHFTVDAVRSVLARDIPELAGA